MRVGVVAVQGAFAEHINMLHTLDIEALPIRLPQELTDLNALIIPGGESTSISQLMDVYQLTNKIIEMANQGLPIFGTCAGMILLANKIPDSDVKPLGLMQITVRRNAFGRQVDSFESDLSISILGEKPFHGVFIRAPMVEQVNGNVEVLATLSNGTIAAARQNQLLVTAFHPELTDDTRFHSYFLDIIQGKK